MFRRYSHTPLWSHWFRNRILWSALGDFFLSNLSVETSQTEKHQCRKRKFHILSLFCTTNFHCFIIHNNIFNKSKSWWFVMFSETYWFYYFKWNQPRFNRSKISVHRQWWYRMNFTESVWGQVTMHKIMWTNS